MARRENEELQEKVARIESVSMRLEAVLPDLEDLLRLRVNLDRLGPRLELIDQIGPRLVELDKVVTLLPKLHELANMVGVMNDVGAVLRRFLDANHEVSETVRVDVETISALGLQIDKSLTEALAELRKLNGA
ncbi:MAG: hypothetical protein FJ267_02660 [Planctomycetes bacterium]|nr:hypothetical protein [Planctomycetota bacterium]